MSEISSSYSSSSRITGLFSQLDTDTIVKDMLKIQQSKVDAKDQDKTTQEWRGEALQEVSDLVEEFKNTYLSALGSGSMVSSSTYTSFKTEITGGDESAVSISTKSSAYSGSYTINSITQLAQNASVASSSKVSSDGTNISESNLTKLSELSFAKKLTFDSDGQISFSINDETFTFKSTDTLQTMINTVNSSEKAGVTMKYSRLSDTFSITADAGGADSSVTIKNISGNAFGIDSAFGIAAGSTKIPGYGTVGQDAILSVNNVSVTKDSNSFSIDGINYTLKDTTAEEINFDVTRDVSATVENIKKFIDAYNELNTKLTDLLNEKDYSTDYKPLTAEQEEEMSEKEIEAWNEKAKSGLLRNDSDLKSFLRSLKNTFSSVLGGTGLTASSIGIAPGNYFTSDAGKIIVDEEDLTKAIEENPERVISMFTETDSSKTGLMSKISGYVKNYSDQLDDSIEASTKEISSIEEKIEEAEDDLDNLSEKYYDKFSVMEQALAKLNSQMSAISSLLSS